MIKMADISDTCTGTEQRARSRLADLVVSAIGHYQEAVREIRTISDTEPADFLNYIKNFYTPSDSSERTILLKEIRASLERFLPHYVRTHASFLPEEHQTRILRRAKFFDYAGLFVLSGFFGISAGNHFYPLSGLSAEFFADHGYSFFFTMAFCFGFAHRLKNRARRDLIHQPLEAQLHDESELSHTFSTYRDRIHQALYPSRD